MLRRCSTNPSCLFAVCEREVIRTLRRFRLMNLTSFTAGVMIPSLCRVGRQVDAIKLAQRHRRLVTSKAYVRVAGAGSDRLEGRRKPNLRLILLAPVSWSLAGHLVFED